MCNRLYLSLLPLLFSAYECYTLEAQFPVFTLLLTITLSCFAVSTCLAVSCKPPDFHISDCSWRAFKAMLEISSTGETYSLFSTEDMEMMKPALYQLTTSYSRCFYINRRLLIIEGRFTAKVWRMADLKFTAIQSTFNMQGDDWITFLVEHTTRGQIFKFGYVALLLPELQKIVPVGVNWSGMIDRFIERFSSYIGGNPKLIWKDTASLEPCFACHAKQPDIIISKNCTEVDCGGCTCPRPLWCASCMARVFAAAQPPHLPGQWMDGQATCPMCRAQFCPNDVLYIVDEADL